MYWKIGLDFILFTLKCMTNNKITLNDLEMAEHLLEENGVKVVEIFFRLNINGNMVRRSEHSRAGLVKIEAYHIGRVPILTKVK
jgi:predicted nuclease with RNAse H fold